MCRPAKIIHDFKTSCFNQDCMHVIPPTPLSDLITLNFKILEIKNCFRKQCGNDFLAYTINTVSCSSWPLRHGSNANYLKLFTYNFHQRYRI